MHLVMSYKAGMDYEQIDIIYLRNATLTVYEKYENI